MASEVASARAEPRTTQRAVRRAMRRPQNMEVTLARPAWGVQGPSASGGLAVRRNPCIAVDDRPSSLWEPRRLNRSVSVAGFSSLRTRSGNPGSPTVEACSRHRSGKGISATRERSTDFHPGWNRADLWSPARNRPCSGWSVQSPAFRSLHNICILASIPDRAAFRITPPGRMRCHRTHCA